MNAAADGDGDDVTRLHAQIADLQAQRARLLEEVSRLREERNNAVATSATLQSENAELRRRIAELEGPPS